MGNIFEREACEHVDKNQSPLFEQDFASMLQTNCLDILAQLEQQSNAENNEPESEEVVIVVIGQAFDARLSVLLSTVVAMMRDVHSERSMRRDACCHACCHVRCHAG